MIEPLEEFLDDLESNQPIKRSQELRALAREILKEQSNRQKEDIKLWAKRLAKDMVEAND